MNVVCVCVCVCVCLCVCVCGVCVCARAHKTLIIADSQEEFAYEGGPVGISEFVY